jgi:hypothetical protein
LPLPLLQIAAVTVGLPQHSFFYCRCMVSLPQQCQIIFKLEMRLLAHTVAAKKLAFPYMEIFIKTGPLSVVCTHSKSTVEYSERVRLQSVQRGKNLVHNSLFYLNFAKK